ncbi:hypothetical protein ACXZ1M_20335 [Duganella sp. PWIR1]
MAQQKNPHFAEFEAASLPLRFASQSGGRSRVYCGADFVEFFGNKCNARTLAKKAETVGEWTHLGRALAELAAQRSMAERLAQKESAELWSVALAPCGQGMSFATGFRL